MDRTERNADAPLDRLNRFLELEDDEVASMSKDDIRHELREEGIDIQRLTSKLTKIVSGALAQSDDVNVTSPTSHAQQERTPVLGVTPVSRMARLRAYFLRLLRLLSKTDSRILARCSALTVTTQTTLGLLVLLNGLFAFLTGTFAIYALFGSAIVAVPVSALYGLVITMVDRELVSSSSKASIVPRLFLGVAVGLVISVPLELRMFAHRIDQEIATNRAQENFAATQRSQADVDLQAKIDSLESEIRKYREGIISSGLAMQDEVVGAAREGRIRTGRAGEGPVYQEARRQKDLYERLLWESETQLLKLKQSRQEELERVRNLAISSAGNDLVARFEALQRIKSLTPTALWMSWGLSLVLIIFQVSPLLVKLLTPHNEYNAIVEVERRRQIARIYAIGNECIAQIANNPYMPVTSLVQKLPPDGEGVSTA